MWNLEVTELIAIIFCIYILYLVISINSLYLDTGPLWVPAFVLKGPPCLNKVFFISISKYKKIIVFKCCC